MDLSISRTDLATLLSSAASAASARSGKEGSGDVRQCYQHVLLDACAGSLRVASSDGYVGFEARVSAAVKKTGQVAVEARRAAEIVKSLPAGDVTIKQLADAVEFRSGKARFKVPTFAAEMPAHPSQAEAAHVTTVPAGELLRALKSGSYARDTDESMARSGVLLDARDGELRVVSASSQRMAMASIACETRQLELVLSSRGYGELVRLCEADKGAEVSIAAYGPTAFFTAGSASLWARMRDDKFAYRSIFENVKLDHKARVSRELFIDALKRVSLACERDKFGATAQLSFSPGSLGVSSVSAGSEADDVLDCDADFDCSLSLNPEHLSQALASVVDDEVTLECSADIRQPCVVRGERTTALVMQRAK